MSADSKNEMFMDVILTSLTLPLLLGGESKKPLVQSLFRHLLELTSHDLELEMPDRQASSLMHLQTALRGVVAITELNPGTLLEYSEEIEVLKATSMKPEEDIASVVHAGHEVPRYKEKLQEASKMMKTLRLHQDDWNQKLFSDPDP